MIGIVENETVNLVGKISCDAEVIGRMSGSANIVGKVCAPLYGEYSGEVTVTPSESTQTLHTSGCVVSSDIVVNPIPDDYARMTWNGTILHFY